MIIDIRNRLNEIAEKKSIKILFACETGSRAWGFPSTDSDYDVRFIYMHKRDWYLALGKRQDNLEFSLPGDLDVTGWDLKKSLMLLKKSNAPLIERFQSPIEYFAEINFKKDFNILIEHYYSPIAVFYHHFSLAKKFWEEIKDKKEVKLKKLFYLLRSLLSCNWIIKDSTLLPMHIEGLMTQINEEYRDKIRKLIELKATITESYSYKLEDSLRFWIIQLFELVDSSQKNVITNSSDYSLLEAHFIKYLYDEINDKLD